jgi:hypothetical protein
VIPWEIPKTDDSNQLSTKAKEIVTTIFATFTTFTDSLILRSNEKISLYSQVI